MKGHKTEIKNRTISDEKKCSRYDTDQKEKISKDDGYQY